MEGRGKGAGEVFEQCTYGTDMDKGESGSRPSIWWPSICRCGKVLSERRYGVVCLARIMAHRVSAEMKCKTDAVRREGSNGERVAEKIVERSGVYWCGCLENELFESGKALLGGS